METTEELKQLVETQQETINGLLARITKLESQGVAPNLLRMVHPENLEINLTEGCCKPKQESTEEPTE